MKTPAVKSKSLQFCAALIAAGVAFITLPALANTELWVGTNDISATTNWSDNLNWTNVTGGGGPGPNGNDVIFGDNAAASGAGIVDSVVDNNSLNPFSLTFTNNSTTGNFHTVLIPDGVGVTNANALVVGIRNSTASSYLTTVGFVGSGTLVDVGSPLQVDNSTSVGSGVLPTLDLSGLTNFVYTNAAGAIDVAGYSGSEARGSGQLNLAGGTNIITVGTINVAIATGNGGIGGTINLGAGTNIINVGTINLAAGKANTATIKFLGPTGGLRIRGLTGADSDGNVTVTLGNRSNSGSGTAHGILNFLGGFPVDVEVNSVTLGRSSSTGPGVGDISFDTGTFDATAINMAVTSNTGGATGNLTVSGGLLAVGDLSMVNQTGTGGGTGNLNINGAGTVMCSNNIVKTTIAGMANITMSGGALIVGNSVGAATNAIDTFTLGDSGLTLSATLNPAIYATTLTAGGTTNTINVTSVPRFFSYPVQFPLISYVTPGGDNNTFVAGSIAGVYQGYISNNVNNLSIDIVITNGPALAALKSITWNGAPTGDWTTNTSTLNWVTNGVSVNYNPGDTVTFNDSLIGTTNVNLTQRLTPSGVTVNNSASNYLFTGVGNISGTTGLTKSGSGTLILDNGGTNDFIGPVTINAGTLQVGNNDANGNLPAASGWDDEGTLAFNRTDNLVISTVVSGAGSLVQNGSGTLSLDAADTYSGNTIVHNGVLTLTANGSLFNSPLVLVQNGAFNVSAVAPYTAFNAISVANGALFVDTNTVSSTTLSATNSTIRLAADLVGNNITVSSLVTGGQTNYINVTAVQNVPDSPALPVVIPVIRYGSANFVGGFNFGETNFPNAYISNDVANSAIDVVLTAAPYVVTWNGGSATGNNWSDSNNWSGATIFPGDSLTFDGSTRLGPVNDTAAGTTYSNITFNAAAGTFTLGGNPILFTGNIVNNSLNSQTINLGLDFNGNVSLNGTAAPLIIAAGLTNTPGPGRYTTNTLTGTGILTNLLGSAGNSTNLLAMNDPNANWTLMDNPASTPITVPWALALNNGTLNFGSASSAPNLFSTSAQGSPQDNQMGTVASSISTLNFSNGTYTTTARLNTGANSGSSSTINQYGGTFNIGNQFQGANATGGSSTVNLYGGTMNIGPSTNLGPFYVASRGNGVLLLTNSAVLNCGVLDVSRTINGGIPGTVNLDGGTLAVSRVGSATANQNGNATGSTATFNFDGGILKANASSTTFFQGRVASPAVPISAFVQSGGAIIDSDTNTISFLEPLMTDPNLGGAVDGGLTKLGSGSLTLSGTNTYIGNTLVGAGTLLVDGLQGQSAVIVSNNATLGGNGVIGSNVTVNAGGSVSPGDNAVGILTVAGNVTLAGTTVMEIDKTLGTNDMLVATNTTATTITYGGTLNVPTISGAIAVTDSFKLFSASNYVGSFSAVTPASPGPGLLWNTNNLDVDGTLRVMMGSGPTTNANILSVSLSGTNLVVHGTNNNGGQNFRYAVLTATNIATPLSNWTAVVTNSFKADGTFDYTNPVVPGSAHQFIDIEAVP